ncbi:MAG: hypothetical protein ACI4MS_01635 [Candidatus Coproplasma sp.]
MAKTKGKKQQGKAVKNKSTGAGKRTTQTKEKTDEGKGKGAKSAPAVRKSCTAKGNKQKLSSPASTRQRSQTSRSKPVANAQSKQLTQRADGATEQLSKHRKHKSKPEEQQTVAPEQTESTSGANAQSQQAEPKDDAITEQNDNNKKLHKRFPFWARLKIGKNRTTLVIDEEPVKNKRTNKTEDGFVHREATHTARNDYEKIDPNPDRTDPEPMYLKRPKKAPQRLFKPHNKDLDMPEEIRKRYEGNNDKKEQ